MCKGLLFDGNDAVATFGLFVATWGGYRDSPAWSYPTVVVPGRAGEVLTDPVAREKALGVTLQGTIIGKDAATTRTFLDKLQWLAARASVRLTLPDDPTRELVCKPTSCVVPPSVARVVGRELPVTLTLLALEPYKRDTTDQVVTPALSGAASMALVGTGPVRPKLTMTATAACNGANWNLYDNVGVLRGSIGTTGALVNGDVVVIDCDARTITKNGADYIAALLYGDFLEIRPEYSDQIGTAALNLRMPSIACGWTSGTGGTGEARYRRRWR